MELCHQVTKLTLVKHLHIRTNAAALPITSLSIDKPTIQSIIQLVCQSVRQSLYLQKLKTILNLERSAGALTIFSIVVADNSKYQRDIILGNIYF